LSAPDVNRRLRPWPILSAQTPAMSALDDDLGT
jgi:hypothetical protein